MSNAKKPNRYLAPLVIAGITVGVLAKAYKEIFKKEKDVPQLAAPKDMAESTPSDATEEKSN